MPSIDISDVTKIYPVGLLDALFMLGTTLAGRPQRPDSRSPRGKVAIDGISLSMREGERIGIIGRNGAGKSTLVHMIAGLSEPSSGRLLVQGHVTSVMTLGVGIKDELTGRENVFLDGELQGRTRAEVDVVLESIIDFAELGEFIDLPVRTYSTGMKARLAFAMITCMDPEILVIDEALSVGDATFAAKASKRIKQLCNNGKLVIVVSHDTTAIVEICSRCVWLENGRLVMDGAPRDVTDKYLEEVRKVDEQNMLTRFKQYSGIAARDPRIRLEEMRFFQGAEQRPRIILEAGVTTCMQIVWTLDRKLDNGDVSVSIERLDGLRVYCESARNKVNSRLAYEVGRHEVLLRMEPLVLGIGYYRITSALLEAGEEVASSSQVVEVFSPVVPRGGRPALLYPASVKARSLQA